jgi:hypothetical protein
MSSRLFGTWPAPSDTSTGQGEEVQGPFCGGTANILPSERARATFDVTKLTHLLDGGEKNSAKKRWIWSIGDDFDNSSNIFLSREEQVREV